MRDKQSEIAVSKIIDRLSDIRKEKGISHEKLAEMTGLNRSTISLIENHKRTPTILTILRISKALDIKLSEILKKLGS
jgi:transcriptional regulator with XRE-family HTH domain